MKHLPLKNLLFVLTLISCSPILANDIDDILAKKQAPAGVVFEIVSDESDLLNQLLASVNADIKRLRSRFSNIPIAIVTHGTEQFALTTKNQKKEKKVHSLVEQLVKNNDIDVHVCGTHAEWYGVMPEDFPEYVDVSAAGPAQINDYEELGYKLIVLP